MRTSTPYGTALCRLYCSVKSKARSRLRAAAQPAAAGAGTRGQVAGVGSVGWRIQACSISSGCGVRSGVCALRCRVFPGPGGGRNRAPRNFILYKPREALSIIIHLTLYFRKRSIEWGFTRHTCVHSGTQRQTHTSRHCDKRSTARGSRQHVPKTRERHTS